ncbi:MAG TPA: 2-dehydropantoate 2-reductase [Anaerolineae bacterium]|nr:2-dehydropantoate 2-reductase [Anaerolineae bacterium]HNU03573.1 2-dehydropantoate 2-reductase [Anaerolineae bacterium]
MTLPTSLLIVGTGALASLFGARLAAAGVQVTMLGSWPEALAALRTQGVRLVESDGREQAWPVRAVADPAECRGIPHALVLVKAWQTDRAGQQLAACLPPNGLALTLQNGWGNRERLEQTLGPQRVALGITTLGATLLAPGVVRAGGQGPVTLGSHPRIQPLAELLGAAGFEMRLAEDVAGLAWGKLVINAAINPLTALLRVPNGALLERPEARELLGLAASEAAAVGRAQGLGLPFDDAVAAAEEVARRTAANHSSMFQDVQRGRPSEIDAICGAVVQAGQRVNLPTPINQTLWLLVRAAQTIAQ